LGKTLLDIGWLEPLCPVLGAATEIDIAEQAILNEFADLLL
jgi:hypothetical protein